jgi:hypothetical protein
MDVGNLGETPLAAGDAIAYPIGQLQFACPGSHAAILGAVHVRIPMPTQDDQRAVMIENARADALLCQTLSAGHAAGVEDQKALLTVGATGRCHLRRLNVSAVMRRRRGVGHR